MLHCNGNFAKRHSGNNKRIIRTFYLSVFIFARRPFKWQYFIPLLSCTIFLAPSTVSTRELFYQINFFPRANFPWWTLWRIKSWNKSSRSRSLLGTLVLSSDKLLLRFGVASSGLFHVRKSNVKISYGTHIFDCFLMRVDFSVIFFTFSIDKIHISYKIYMKNWNFHDIQIFKCHKILILISM